MGCEGDIAMSNAPAFATVVVGALLAVSFVFGYSLASHRIASSQPRLASVVSTLNHYREVAAICGHGNVEMTEKPFSCIDWGMAAEQLEASGSAQIIN